MIDEKALAAAMRSVARGLTDAAAILDGDPEGAADRKQREAELALEFEWEPGNGLTREAASLACKRHDFAPQVVGSWVRAGWIEEVDGLRYLTAEGRAQLIGAH